MIVPRKFHDDLQAAGVEFFCGVPDSLLKEFCAYVDAVLPIERHVITANEGAAVALAAGYHLASGTVPLVYMQNSGLGNAVNPLLSLADPEVYSVPMILLVGWRGEPGVKDEPQHVKQGRVTPAILESMGIPYHVLESDADAATEVARMAVDEAVRSGGPFVLLARKDVFEKSDKRRVHPHAGEFPLARERAIECLLENLPEAATVVSTTGKISRELYELREQKGQGHAADFLTVGSMGHASQIALGIAMAAPDKLVACVDGDGAVLMHLGGLTTVAASKAPRFLHIVLNNGAHESVGGQPTVALDMSISDVARAVGYRTVLQPVENEKDLVAAVADLVRADGPALLEVRVAVGARSDLGRPNESPRENKQLFMERLRGGQ